MNKNEIFIYQNQSLGVDNQKQINFEEIKGGYCLVVHQHFAFFTHPEDMAIIKLLFTMTSLFHLAYLQDSKFQIITNENLS